MSICTGKAKFHGMDIYAAAAKALPSSDFSISLKLAVTSLKPAISLVIHR